MDKHTRFPCSVSTFGLLLLLIALLLPGQSTAAQACPNAPRSRLAAGMIAVVAPGIGALNVRRLPAVGAGVADRLYSGNRVTVISGPSCNGGLNWWRVTTGAHVTGWVAEGTWLAYWLIPAHAAGRILTPLMFSCPPLRPIHCYVPE